MPDTAPAAPAAFLTLDDDAAAALHAYRPTTNDQDRQRRRVLDHLAGTPGATWRGSGPVHLTASLLVLDPTGRHVLLAQHKKARLWLQMGGHLEEGDATVRAAAEREGREESGLADLRALPGLVEVDCHRLGAGFTRCAEHLDLRYVAVAPAGAPVRTSAESDDVRWFAVDHLPPQTGPDVPRLLAAARRALRAHPTDSRA